MDSVVSLAKEDYPVNAVMELRSGKTLDWSPNGTVVGAFNDKAVAQMFFEQWLRETMAGEYNVS